MASKPKPVGIINAKGTDHFSFTGENSHSSNQNRTEYQQNAMQTSADKKNSGRTSFSQNAIGRKADTASILICVFRSVARIAPIKLINRMRCLMITSRSGNPMSKKFRASTCTMERSSSNNKLAAAITLSILTR